MHLLIGEKQFKTTAVEISVLTVGIKHSDIREFYGDGKMGALHAWTPCAPNSAHSPPICRSPRSPEDAECIMQSENANVMDCAKSPPPHGTQAWQGGHLIGKMWQALLASVKRCGC